MPSAASASIRALAPREAAPATQPLAPTVAPAPPAISVPAMPSLPVVNPETAAQESWIRDQLNPASAAFVGNKYKPEIQAAGAELKQGLAGFGGFDFTEGEMGTLTAKERVGTGESLGEEYRRETLRSLQAANQRGMQNSRMADEAIGLSWSRLNQQKRDFFTRYATTASGALNRMQSEISGLTTNLLDLYGKDAQYAMENPIIGATEQDIAAASGAPVAPTAPSPGAPKAPVLWHGKVRPKMATVAKRHGVTVADLQRKTRGGGKGYVVVRR